MCRRWSWIVAAVVTVLPGEGVTAQEASDCGVSNLAACIPDELRGLLPDNVDFAALAKDPKTIVNLLEDPQTLNRLLRAAGRDTALANLLGDLEVDFKTFHSADSSATALGLSYSYDKSVISTPGAQTGTSFSGFELALQAQGNVSFNPDLNPRNFLESTISIGYVQSRGGVRSGDLDGEFVATTIERFADITDQAQLDTESAVFMASLKDQLSTQVFLSFGLSGSLEADQSFDQKQFAGLATLGLDIKAWNPNTALARFNLFDWPFAAVRYLMGTDEHISPRGSNIPTLLVSVGMVDPTDNAAREALGEMDAYPRVSAELSFKSVVIDTEQMTIAFESDFRYFRELGASDAVVSANLDDTAYFVGALVSSNGMFVSFSSGRLPLDLNNDAVYELGFKFKF